MNTINESLDMTMDISSEVVETKATAKKTRDPLAKFNELSESDQSLVQNIVDDVIGKIGGVDELNLSLLLGTLDKLNALKKTAKEIDAKKQKEAKIAQKQLEAARGDKVKEHLIANKSHVDYTAKSAGVVFENVEVIKITEKRFHVQITPNTACRNIKTGKSMLAKDLVDFKMEKPKYVAFDSIVAVDGVEISEYLASFEEDMDVAAEM